jgi:ribosomal protein S18 acetylase RimI-like enzyme
VTFEFLNQNSNVLNFTQLAEIHKSELGHVGINLPKKVLSFVYRLLLNKNIIQILVKFDQAQNVQGFIITQNKNKILTKLSFQIKYLLFLPLILPFLVVLLRKFIHDRMLYNRLAYDKKIVVVCVRKKDQRIGIGKLLMNYLMEGIDQDNLVVLDTKIDNFNAISFYEKLNFKKLKQNKNNIVFGLRK